MRLPTTDLRNLPAASFWRDIFAALQGGTHDYTREPINRAILLLAVPMVLEMLMESLFALVNMFWVSRLGSDAIATVGLIESVMGLIYVTANGVSIAASATVARRIGEGKPQEAARAAAQAFILGIAISAALGVAFLYFAVEVLRLMGATPAMTAHGTRFAQVMLGGNVTVVMIFLVNAIFRGSGDAALAMRTLCLANLLNIALAPCFIFGWGPFSGLGLTGAAVATNVARGSGVLYQVWHLTRAYNRVRLELHHFRPAPEVLRNLLVTSANGAAQGLIGTTSWLGLYKILAMYGSAALAGYTIAIRVAVFALLPAQGLASAAATLVGQNLGAMQPDQADAAVKLATRRNVVVLTVVGAGFVLFSDALVRVFTMDPQVFAYAQQALWIVSLAFPSYAIAMCLSAAFNGAGDTWTPTRMNLYFFWAGQIPFAWLLAEVFRLGPLGVFIAVPTSTSALALGSYVLFKQGKWKLLKI